MSEDKQPWASNAVRQLRNTLIRKGMHPDAAERYAEGHRKLFKLSSDGSLQSERRYGVGLEQDMGDALIEDLASEMYAGAGSLDKSPRRLSDEELEQLKEQKMGTGEYAM